MALTGGNIGFTGYQQPNYAGAVEAASLPMQAIGQGIAQAQDYFKQQGEKKKLIKQSDIQIDAALKLFPDLAPTLQGVRDQIKDENVSLNERADIAESVAGLIKMGTNQMQANAEFGLKKRQLDIEEGQGIQSALNEQARLQAEANKPGRIVEVNLPDGTQQLRENPRTGVLEPIQVAGQTPAAGITSALGDAPPMDIPTTDGIIVPANEGVVSQDGTTVSYLGRQYIVDTGVLPGRPPNEQAASIDAGLSVAPAKGSIGFKPKETKEVKVITGPEAKAKGLDPAGTYEETYENGQRVGVKTITPPPTISQIAQVEKSKADVKASEAEVQKAQRSKDIAIKTMSDYVDAKGRPTERLNKAVGYGEEAATVAAEYAPIFGTQSGETRSDQDRLMRLVETDVLEAASLLKPVSNTDLLMLIKNRPTITKPTEVWTKYFSDIKQILSNPENYISSDGGSEVEAPKNPLSANERLRARLTPQGNR